MDKRFAFVLAILISLPHIATAQGSAYNPSNWDITYVRSGTTTSIVNGLTQTYCWPTAMSLQVKGYATVATQGEVKVVLTWIGSGAAPQYVNIIVYSSALQSGNAGGSVDDFFGDPIVATNISKNQSGQHMKSLKVSDGVATFTAFLNATSSSTSGLCSAGCGLSVSLDPRFARISVDGHPTNYKRVLTGNTMVLPVTLSDGQTKNIMYPEAIKTLNDQIVTGPLTSGGTLYLGLPLQKQEVVVLLDETGKKTTQKYPSNLMPSIISFVGEAFQLFGDSEHYDWTSDQGGFGSDCPTYLYGWDIRPKNNEYETPAATCTNDYTIPNSYNISYTPGALNSGGVIGFHYHWPDGVDANCQDQIEFHRGSEYNGEAEGSGYYDFDPSYPWTPVPFNVNWVPAGYGSYNVVVKQRDWALFAANFVFTIAIAPLGAIEGPVGIGLAMFAAGYGITFSSMVPDDVTQPFPFGGQEAFDAAAGEGRVSPADWQTYFPTGFNLNAFAWKADYRPQVFWKWSIHDTWDLDGFQGRDVEPSKAPQDMFASVRRYWFQLTTTRQVGNP